MGSCIWPIKEEPQNPNRDINLLKTLKAEQKEIIKNVSSYKKYINQNLEKYSRGIEKKLDYFIQELKQFSRQYEEEINQKRRKIKPNSQIYEQGIKNVREGEPQKNKKKALQQKLIKQTEHITTDRRYTINNSEATSQYSAREPSFFQSPNNIQLKDIRQSSLQWGDRVSLCSCKQEMEKMEKQLKKQSKKSQVIQEEICNYKKQNSSLMAKTKSLAQQKKNLQEAIEKLQYSLKRREEQVLKKKQRQSIHQQEDERENNRGRSFTTENNFSFISKMFSDSKILPAFYDFDNAIETRKIIEKMFKRQIKNTNKLYSFDNVHPSNFQDYIEFSPNVFLIIKLQNKIIGGFSGQQCQGKEKYKNSFLFSIDGSTSLLLQPKKDIKKINVNPHYLCFGVSELKVQSRTKKCSQKVNGIDAIFRCNDKNVPIKKFFGHQEKQFQALDYELYEIIFSKDNTK